MRRTWWRSSPACRAWCCPSTARRPLDAAFVCVDRRRASEGLRRGTGGDVAALSRQRPSAVLGPHHRQRGRRRERPLADGEAQGASGSSDVREQPFDLPPQWMPQSWSVSASGGGKERDARQRAADPSRRRDTGRRPRARSGRRRPGDRCRSRASGSEGQGGLLLQQRLHVASRDGVQRRVEADRREGRRRDLHHADDPGQPALPVLPGAEPGADLRARPGRRARGARVDRASGRRRRRRASS